MRFRVPGEGSELHRQIYGSHMQYPMAMKQAAIVAFNAGLFIGAGMYMLVDWMAS